MGNGAMAKGPSHRAHPRLYQNGPRPLLAYWCEPQEVRTSGESPINDLLDFWPLGRRLGAGRSYSAKPPP